MKNTDEQKIKDIIFTRKKAHSFYLKNSEVYQSFSQMEQLTYKDGAISKMNKELIAIGCSILLDCESCLEWHIKEALNDGATNQQIIEAIEVGIEMACGRATISARFAMNVLDYLKDKTTI